MENEKQSRRSDAMKNWRAWGSWFSWGSPVGLSLGYAIVVVSSGLALWLTSLATINFNK